MASKKLNRKWYSRYPRLKILTFIDSNGNEKEYLYCKKDGSLISIEVCAKSIHRFDLSKTCRKCFGVKSKDSFPEWLLKAEKVIHLPESKMIVEAKKKKLFNIREEEND